MTDAPEEMGELSSAAQADAVVGYTVANDELTVTATVGGHPGT